MAQIELKTKAIATSTIIVGSITGPILEQFVDTRLANEAVAAGRIKRPEAYPLYMRPGVMVPLITGIPTLLAGLFGDRWIRDPNVQLGLLTYGTAATTSGLCVLARGIRARQAVGIKLLFPAPDEMGKDVHVPRAPTYIHVPVEIGKQGAAQGGRMPVPLVRK